MLISVLNTFNNFVVFNYVAFTVYMILLVESKDEKKRNDKIHRMNHFFIKHPRIEKFITFLFWTGLIATIIKLASYVILFFLNIYYYVRYVIL